MNEIVKSDDALGVWVERRAARHSSGIRTDVYKVFRRIDGKILPIGNGESGSLEAALKRFDDEVAQLQGSKP